MATSTWQLDVAHSDVSFRVRHLLVATATGKFTNCTSSVHTEEDDFSTAQIEFSVETASIHTGVADRDAHLQSDEFFASATYPTMTFKANGLKHVEGDNYTVTGELTIRDVSKEVTLDVEFGGIAKDPWGNIKAGFEVNGKINRKDFGLSWDALTEAGGAVVANEVKIHANLEYAKVVPA
ncbi:MAG: YceI family protein [Bacteroidetes bacterium]|nr:YceI family protein [Bacteroidota bacterium]